MMDEIISNGNEQNIYSDVEDNEEWTSSSISCNLNGDIVNKKSSNKINHIILK
jgi:hypothetical protein